MAQRVVVEQIFRSYSNKEYGISIQADMKQ